MILENENINDQTPKIRVVIRKRPINKKELAKGDMDVVEVQNLTDCIVKETKCKVDLTKYVEQHKFSLDYVFDETNDNQAVYNEIVKPLVGAAFNNKSKVTCFAYGQTGSGKTYTMMGDPGNENQQNQVPGLYLLAANDIFGLLKYQQFQHLSIWISFYEIYCGKLFDLLNDRQQLQIREDAKQNVNIVGLQEKQILNINTLMQLINFGMSVRVTNMTGANDDSSRSHAILQIQIKDGPKKLHGKLSFIDLAGSERAADVTDQNKQTRIDGAEINKSLLALKECIRALDQDKSHTPFRGSKLTLVLKDSFIGNCKTVMIGNISPAGFSCENTLNTLRYADRVKELKKGGDRVRPQTAGDILAQQLMLPRMAQNSTKTIVNNNEEEQNLMKQINQVNDQQQLQYQQQQYQQQQFQQSQQQQNNFVQPKRPSMPLQQQQFMQEDFYHNNNLHRQSSYQNNNYNNFGMNNNVQSYQNFNNQQKFNQQQNNNQFQAKKINNNGIDYSSQGFNLMQDQQYPNGVIGKVIENNLQQPYMGQNPTPYPQPNMPQFNKLNQDNFSLEEISKKHEKLIKVILNEEEELITQHRNHIDQVVELTKNEMMILQDVDQPGSDVDSYIQNLENLLNRKISMINLLKQKLVNFKMHLKEEEQLSLIFHEKKNNQAYDVFELQKEDQGFHENDLLSSDINI